MATKTQTQTVSQTFEFESVNFPSLTLRDDFGETWNDISLYSLSPVEQDGLCGLLNASGLSTLPAYKPEKVLLVKAEKGILKGVYGPALFRQGDQIILKIGENAGLVQQKGDRLLIGQLKGKITVIEKEDARKNKYPTAFCTFVSPDKSIFKVRVSLDSQQQGFSAGELEAVLVNEEPILPYLAQVPTPAVGMQNLDVGEYEVIATSIYEGEHGISYKLYLAIGITVWARGNSEVLLRSGYTKPVGVPLTLIITNIEEFAPGKFKVDNALRERLPQLAPSSQPQAETILTSAEEIVDEDEIDEAELGDLDEDSPF